MKIKEDLVCVLMLDIFLESNKREENITLDVVFLCGFLAGLVCFAFCKLCFYPSFALSCINDSKRTF